MFYSSKSFADPTATSRTMIGWVGEEGGPIREWSGLQSVPRTVSADPDYTGRVLFLPIDALKTLRGKAVSLGRTSLQANTSTLTNASGVQLDIVADFQGPF